MPAYRQIKRNFFQQTAYRLVKDGLLRADMPSVAGQKITFYKPIDYQAITNT